MAWSRIFLVVILAFNLALAYRLLWGEEGVIAYMDLKDRYQELSQRVDRLDQENRELSQEIRLLKSDRDYLEQVVRDRLHYVAEDEVLYRLGPSNATSPEHADQQDHVEQTGHSDQPD